jgi:DNA helicase-2/ATP-dependent DNA helicase PcrA
MQEGFGKDAPATLAQAQSGLDQYIEGAELNASSALAAQSVNAKSEGVNELPAGWVNFDTGETLSPLAAFLSHAALEAGDNQAQAGQDAVQLMTVHAAKGLEFDCVFITGLEEGLFPHENSLSSVEGLEEERRLMYVALTRARKRLYLSHAQTRMLHGQTRFNLRSRFFDEMPEHTMKWVNSKKPALPSSSRGYSGASHVKDFSSSAYTPAWARSVNTTGKKSSSEDTIPMRSKASDASDPHAWMKVGMKVFHNKFGEGRILALEGIQDDARAQVDFPRHGVKWLALSLAKLTPID